jgi:methylglyoxal synthase
MYNIPVATNIATAEVLITALDRGDLDWRELINPHSAKNRSKKKV